MTTRSAMLTAGILLTCGRGAAEAQHGRVTGNDVIIAKCGGAANVIVVPGGLGCKSAPSTDTSSIAGWGQVFMDLLGAMEADAQRRAAEQRARRAAALNLLQQHRIAALNRQDAARAQQLQEIEGRIDRNEHLFKGLTGAGAQLAPKTSGGGALQPKTGRAATASLNPPASAPVPSSAGPAAGSDSDALIKAFNQLPAAEQLALVEELRRGIAPPPEELRDAPAPAPVVAKTLDELEPAAIPQGMTPEEAKAYWADQFFRETGERIEDVLNRTPVAPPEPPDPPTGAEPPRRKDPCISRDPNVVDFCHIADRIDRASQPNAGPPPVPSGPPPVRPRPLTAEETRLAHVTEPFDSRDALSVLAKRHQPDPTPAQRLEVAKLLLQDASLRYVTDPVYAARVDALIDREVAHIRAERKEMELQAWDKGKDLLLAAIGRTGIQNPDAAALLKNQGFVQERDRIARQGAEWRRQIQIVQERRLFEALWKGLREIK